jgi:hypothetical protein
MPKATWGSGDEALSAADIDGAERQETRKRYSGELPRSGTYRFVIQSIKKAESSKGNPKATITATLDGSWRKNHAEFDGCPIWDHLPIMKSTAERVANFLDAIGATSTDLMKNAIIDENGYITKLGSVGDPAGLMVFINVKYVPARDGYQPKLETDYNAYSAVDDPEETGEGGTGATGEDPPF